MSENDRAEEVRTLDVREVDGEPFAAVVAALGGLSEDETLVLVNSFEPEPLYGVLAERGLDYETERVDDEEWHVHIILSDTSS
ncbi:MAG: DUF2249 domain-containing protein [Haloarculaceae archaeon]